MRQRGEGSTAIGWSIWVRFPGQVPTQTLCNLPEDGDRDGLLDGFVDGSVRYDVEKRKRYGM
jgi:hypothetical protein